MPTVGSSRSNTLGRPNRPMPMLSRLFIPPEKRETFRWARSLRPMTSRISSISRFALGFVDPPQLGEVIEVLNRGKLLVQSEALGHDAQQSLGLLCRPADRVPADLDIAALRADQTGHDG